MGISTESFRELFRSTRLEHQAESVIMMAENTYDFYDGYFTYVDTVEGPEFWWAWTWHLTVKPVNRPKDPLIVPNEPIYRRRTR